MSVAWSWAFDTPFKWTKQVASHFGGTRQGMAMAWPDHIKDAGGIRTQFHHMIDIVPTILEATGIPAPVMVNGVAQKPIEGVSMAYTWDKANANAPSTRETQYFEMFGNRGIYHDGWYANTTPPAAALADGQGRRCPTWSTATTGNSTISPRTIRRTTTSPPRCPTSCSEMQELFLVEAAKYNVFPLDNSILERILTPRPSATAGRNVFTYTGEISGPARQQCAEHPEPVLHDHRRCRGAGRTAATACS